ncbi:2-hydroxyacid dehydrogenase [Paenibacillus mendelii]|uniref:2-hydroxyacid dehydrogenase n=1 Tax=Paenibacillus mendelii TaxID=206163 RepID=A0ABV6JH39_9BACL|nr:D-glycerate dehydrogenase [Paenibacillus mendelii]MCQ6557642.1 D-glycerate dehydrogenase [Paenibacillus mendelii]
MNSKPKVLVSRQFVGDTMRQLRELYDVREWKEPGPMPLELLQEWIADCDGYYGSGDPLSEKVIEHAPRLKVVSHVAVGTDNIDIAACTARGIAVCNTPGVLTDATADMTIALLLDYTRRMPEQIQFVRSGQWKMNTPTQLLGTDIRGKTLGIIGLGEIGEAAARRAAAFGMKVIYHNRKPKPGLSPELAEYTSLNQLLQTADFVSLHAPLTAETHHLINAERLSFMKPSAVLINMARGAVVDTDALYHALAEGIIAGAAMDVTDPEPIPQDHPLLGLPNVIITPHAGSATFETRNAMALLALDNMNLVLQGLPPKHCVNPDAWVSEVKR